MTSLRQCGVDAFVADLDAPGRFLVLAVIIRGQKLYTNLKSSSLMRSSAAVA